MMVNYMECARSVPLRSAPLHTKYLFRVSFRAGLRFAWDWFKVV